MELVIIQYNIVYCLVLLIKRVKYDRLKTFATVAMYDDIHIGIKYIIIYFAIIRTIYLII